MRNLTATLCLTITLLLGGTWAMKKLLVPFCLTLFIFIGSVGMSESADWQKGLTRSGEDDPFQILGLYHQVDDATLKTTYRALVRENYLDKLIAEGLPEEFIEMANKKLAAINNVYDQICKQRGLN